MVTEETFRLTDFLGKVFVMGTMVVWCPMRTQQQGQIKRARAQLDDQVAFISVDMDPNEDEEVLIRYVNNRDWGWSFVAPGSDLARQLSSITSRLILEPTATPVIVIDPEGGIHLLRMGIKTAAQLLTEIDKYRG